MFCRRSSISKQEHVFPPGKSVSSSAAAGALRSAVPRHWLICVLFGFFNDHKSDNLMAQSQDCRLDAATLSIPNLWWSPWGALLCAACRRGALLVGRIQLRRAFRHLIVSVLCLLVFLNKSTHFVEPEDT